MLQGTFSITARCPRSGQFGVAVASKYLAVGAAVPFVRAGVGAVATQARGNPLFGPEGLDLMAQGVRPGTIVERFGAKDTEWEHRQVHPPSGGPGTLSLSHRGRDRRLGGSPHR